MGKMP